jgi:hypothetical protein
LTFSATPRGRNGARVVTARLGETPVFTHKLDVADADQRAAFADRLCKDHEGLDRSWVAATLEQLAADPGPGAGADQGAGPAASGADARVALTDEAELFHTGDVEDEVYATVPVGDHRETWPVKSDGFRTWLRRQYWLRNRSAPSAAAFNDAIAVIEAKARFDGQAHKVSVRLAGGDDEVWLDLGDTRCRAVRITPAGWQVVEDPPVKFRRTRGMLPLPEPVRGGSIDELFPFVNLGGAREKDSPGRSQQILLKACLVTCLRPGKPYPVLEVTGEQGSGKTTFVRVFRSLIDPNLAPLRSPPHEELDLVIAAKNTHIIAIDNQSAVPPWLSDALCRLTTGSGFSRRRLYTDDAEALFEATRPVILNGIHDLAVNGDLLDRAVRITLPQIPDTGRRTEAEFRGAFEAVRPRVLGALLDAVSIALRRLPGVRLAKKPRMADFATWAVAAADGLGYTPDEFLDAYEANRAATVDQVLDDSAVGAAVLGLMKAQGKSEWAGTSGELLKALADHADEATRKRKDWPQNGKGLSNALRRLAPHLRRPDTDGRGVEIQFPDPNRRHGHGRRRVLTMTWSGTVPSAPSATPQPQPSQDVNCGWFADGTRTVPGLADGTGARADGASRDDRPRSTLYHETSSVDADGADGTIPGALEEEGVL